MNLDLEPIFKRNDKQPLAWKLIADKFITLLFGGSRSGKTFIAIVAIIFRALCVPRSDHLILRKTYKDCRRSIFNKTLPDAFRILFGKQARNVYTDNKTDSVIHFKNGSRIFCEGLDENRVESILGNEYATIFFNEISQVDYEVFEVVCTRLAQVCKYTDTEGNESTLQNKIICDCNPPKKRHWAYKLFIEGIKPDDGTKVVDFDTYGTLKMNPVDNIEILGDGYINLLSRLSASKRKRFKDGEWGDDVENALVKQAWIDKARAHWDKDINSYVVPDLARVVVAVDPAVTNNENSDEVGIITAGRWYNPDLARNEFFVMADESAQYGARDWAQASVDEYYHHNADRIVGEVNQGGDLVEVNIRTVDKDVPYKSVRATRGKAVRAEPIAALYEQGRVHHIGEFPELEDELTTWTPEDSKSPNRFDAVVWAITELLTSEEFTVSDYEAMLAS